MPTIRDKIEALRPGPHKDRLAERCKSEASTLPRYQLALGAAGTAIALANWLHITTLNDIRAFRRIYESTAEIGAAAEYKAISDDLQIYLL